MVITRNTRRSSSLKFGMGYLFFYHIIIAGRRKGGVGRAVLQKNNGTKGVFIAGAALFAPFGRNETIPEEKYSAGPLVSGGGACYNTVNVN
ncbi:hypothetical protein [Intestinimonas butyriciproducens]|uniref:hypothetical protein n=1 Tax=Intestinimonas butyriciproducens TaxID=1297617 RepID=UPI0034A35ACA